VNNGRHMLDWRSLFHPPSVGWGSLLTVLLGVGTEPKFVNLLGSPGIDNIHSLA
jgi:hypothetical protein